jgi:hypothetical protein
MANRFKGRFGRDMHNSKFQSGGESNSYQKVTGRVKNRSTSENRVGFDLLMSRLILDKTPNPAVFID